MIATLDGSDGKARVLHSIVEPIIEDLNDAFVGCEAAAGLMGRLGFV